jgi:hypothetical protein
VYVEFLIAFFPLFVLFFSICQIALIASARIIVEHSAQRAVRSAIVVLNEPPADFGGAPRGSLSRGRSPLAATPEALLRELGVDAGAPQRTASVGDRLGSVITDGAYALTPQGGARMAEVRKAAYFPLLALSPRATSLRSVSLADSLPSDFATHMQFSLAYVRAAASISLHDAPGEAAPASDPVDPKAPITVRVVYFYRCAVPLARTLLCSTLSSLIGPKGIPTQPGHPLVFAEAPGELRSIAGESERFVVLTAEATLPNQGAGYTDSEDDT